MDKETLDDVIVRLDRLEKIVGEINEKLSSTMDELMSDTSKNCNISDEKTESNMKDNKDENIGVKIIEEILGRMGYPPDFDPGTIEELRESMRQSGIRAEDNEFSRAIIEERDR